MSGSKEISKIQENLKRLFRKGTPKSRIEEFALTENVQNDLSATSPIAVRTKAIKDLCELVLVNRLEDRSVEKLWGLCQDLVNEQSNENRHLVFSFLHCLIKGQYERLGIMRGQFFRIIKLHNNPEDTVLRFELMQALTDNGKDILYFEEEVGPFLLNWMPEIIQAKKIQEFLSVLVTVVKFNAAYIEENVIDGLIQHISVLCCTTTEPTVVVDSLQVMDTIIAYSYLSSVALTHAVVTLCRVVVVEEFYEPCCKVMRNLLGTYNGHSTLRTLCACLCEKDLREDTGLLSGAVFFISMALWGPQPLPNLRCPPSAVLPSFLCAAETYQPRVQLEIIIHLQQLINRLGIQLYVAEWDIIVTILKVIGHQIAAAPNTMPNPKVAIHFHDTLTTIESLIEISKFNGEVDRFYELIEECASKRPEPSIMKLITYTSSGISPITHMWLTKLDNLIKKYYRQESRTTIRLKVINVLANTVKANRDQYEDELIDGIVIPHFLQIANDSDGFVRASVAQLLVELCKGCETKKCLELLDILERLITRPFELCSPDMAATDSDLADVKIAIMGLIEVFVLKIYRLPSIHAIRIYKMLVTHLEQHYVKPKIFENFNEIRHKILECFLKMRADRAYRIGYPDSNGKLKFSSYISITYRNIERGPMSSPPPASPAINQQPDCTVTYVSLRRAFKIIIMCLKQEKDWEVLHLVLQCLPQVLQNKYLILSKQGNNEIDLLVNTLSSMITDRNLSLPESLKNPLKPNRTDFHASVLNVLANLASYHMYLDQVHQQKMIRCLVKFGLVPRCSKQCINALTICTLEMQDVMVKMLPEVLLDLSKVSATVHIASPILDFLSTLTRIPTVFASFVGDQYMAVFAISLPFTNPFKYNHYIVSLAHHVIAVWFLKCRLPFRRDFIKYITKGLQTNVLVPFEETNIRTNLSNMNEDSSNRKRSSSLTEQSSRRRERASAIARPDGKPGIEFRPTIDRALLTFYEELTETCIDFMGRYTFSSCNALPRRSPNTDYLLENGHSMTWFYGNKLITITTSGCSQKAIKHDLCDKCFQSCRLDGSADVDSSVLKTTRSGSSDKDRETSSTHVTRQNSGEKSNNDTSTSSPIEENKKLNTELEEELPAKLQKLMSTDRSKPPSGKQLCTCWCQCWAEIYIRRATGDISWIMKIQNQLPQHATMDYYPYTGMLMPTIQRHSNESSSTHHPEEGTTSKSGSTASVPISIPGSPCKHSPSRQSSRDSIDEDMEGLYEDGSKSRNPVRRSNSSPEMSASWKNPFLQKQERERDDTRMQEEDGTKKTKTYTKDMRVSCEAIPEEIAGMGTTPPSNEPLSSTKDTQHPILLSCHSYPGSAPPAEQTLAPKPAHTVPPSPNIIHSAPPLSLSLTQTSFSRGSSVHSGILKSSKSESVESVGSEKSIERPSTLASLSSLPPLSSKPPQSPTQTSPRLPRHVKEGHEIQKSSSLNLERTHSLKMKDKKSESERQSQSDLNQAQKRDRGYTISVMSTTRKPRLENLRQAISSRPKDFPRSGINPSFVFLQMYYSAQFGNTNEKPILVSSSQVVQRAVKVLDCIPPYETHRIGVIYVGEGQCNNEMAILRNCFGSIRYLEFLEKLGTLVKLQDVDPQMVYLGGLEQNGNDGKFTYMWQDDVIRVTFHVATLMPNKETDPNCTNKKQHIGNNNVTIVYNESGEEYNINTIKGQFNFACIIVQPMDNNTNKVTIKAKDELIELMGSSDSKMVSDQNVALYARQLALHADLASLVSRSLKSQSQDPYASNWLERLRKIKNVRAKILQEGGKEPVGEESGARPATRWMEDFSDFV